MSDRYPSLTARRLLGILFKAGFEETRRTGSHRILRHPDGRQIVFAFHDGEEIGPVMVARVAKKAGLTLEDF